MKRVLWGFGVVLLVGLAASAEAKKYRSSYAGTSVVTSIDSNGDGALARDTIVQAKTNLGGRGIGRGVLETTPLVPAGPGECEGLDLGEGTIVRSTLVSAWTVTTLEDGSQRFDRGDSGFTCVNATTGVLAGEINGTFTGGTGKWAAWTGTYTNKVRGQAFSLSGEIVAVSGETTGELTKAK